MSDVKNKSLSTIDQLVSQPYKYGFETEIENERIPVGLDENTVRLLSEKKNEPEFMRKSRLQAGWYKPNLSLRERYEVWRNSLVDKNTGKHFSIQTIRYGVHRTFITGLSVSQGVPIQKESDVSMDEHVSDVILYSSGTAVHKLELQTGLRRDMKNFQDFSRSFQRAVVAFLLCVKRSRRNSSGDICLADLPSDVIRDIIAKMAMPVYKWRQKPHVRWDEDCTLQ